MPTTHFHVQTKLAPAVVMGGLTDFGASRSEVWPNVDRENFKVHGSGPGWAEVTEGSSIAGGVWERERYTWDGAAGTVAVETLESNIWGEGSRWDYRLVPVDGGTRIDVTVVRNPLNVKARLIAFGLVLFGPTILRSQMAQATARISARATAESGGGTEI